MMLTHSERLHETFRMRNDNKNTNKRTIRCVHIDSIGHLSAFKHQSIYLQIITERYCFFLWQFASKKSRTEIMKSPSMVFAGVRDSGDGAALRRIVLDSLFESRHHEAARQSNFESKTNPFTNFKLCLIYWIRIRWKSLNWS